MADAPNAILGKMLERLFASLINGPGLNCRPHSSRQRVDWAQLARLLDQSPEDGLRVILGIDHRVKFAGRAVAPKRALAKDDPAIELSESQRREQRQWTDQQSLLSKLRTITEDARTYEQDTGVHVLNIGFPLLSIPHGAGAKKSRAGGERRIVAPIAFIPITLEVKTGTTPVVDIRCKGDGVDLVRPNIALLAWLEQQTGKRTPELFDDTAAENPWREIQELVQHAARSLDIPTPELFSHPAALTEEFTLSPAPRTDDENSTPSILAAAVLGLFPMANEGLLRDMQALAGGEKTSGPIGSFLSVDVTLHANAPEQPDVPAEDVKQHARKFADERLVTLADPCQGRAVRLARHTAGLVIHGPPGTGKSQTITNIIGDHLARGQRILMVCDKRTALDVVAHRLDHLGFGPLVALVHDPQQDQRDLYRNIRERLEALADVRTKPAAQREIEKADTELQSLHGDLTAYWKSLMSAVPAGGSDQPARSPLSFHDLMGQWLAIGENAALHVDVESLGDLPLEEARSHARILREIFERGHLCDYARNLWPNAAAISLNAFLSKPLDYFRNLLQRCIDAAQPTRIAVDEHVPALDKGSLETQASLRLEVADALETIAAFEQPEIPAIWAGQRTDSLTRAARNLEEHASFLETFRAAAIEKELLLATKSAFPSIASLTADLGKLSEYLPTSTKWYACFCFSKKKLAREALTPLGLPVSAENARRAHKFLSSLRARLVLRDLLDEFRGQRATAGLPDDVTLDAQLRTNEHALGLLLKLRGDKSAKPLAELVASVFAQPQTAAAMVDAVRKSAARAAAMARLEGHLGATELFAADWLASYSAKCRAGEDAVPPLEAMLVNIASLEHALRIRDALLQLPPRLRAAVVQLLQLSAPVDEGLAALDKSLLGAEISHRLRTDPVLQSMDGQRLKTSFERYRLLEAVKKEHVRDAAIHRWVSVQKERLLASTGTRMSPLGADLRRRLTMRGERAMRLRQVIDVGAAIADGDPLFDMCPVWMASPETVAQLFPRLPLFDVVIFDEASQCRLEEALPVLTRGKRVVIAGDPKQLPPTRFFESAVVTSDEEDARTEQELFESQQGEVEDLLTAALNLSIENAYLDVHYRSRNSDLIRFSNEQFYNSRLQAIPGHPANSTRFSPLTLYRADGTYEDRQNIKEAEQVCRIVRDLLRRADPPSIGIACFNLQQRDLILEKLDELAEADADFSQRLAAARTRRGAGSFDGLFVKNLENVQGDERDHIIISTTYGPDATGRFFQRFGPLGRAGGGRRLNVLITRARAEVHLVTSIPAQLYRQLPPIPPGRTPGGAWLLYSYLQFAENLAELYSHETDENSDAAASTGALPARVLIREPQPQALPSQFSESLAARLAATARTGSTVHWGNDGFCVDLALAHPVRNDAVTIGILCDGTRFLQAADPVEWDVFRTAIHESQGWTLHRIWTPQFFRDSHSHFTAIHNAVRAHLAAEKPADTLDVVPTIVPDIRSDSPNPKES